MLESIEFYYTLIPCHYIIGDSSGDSFVWEYTNDRQQRYVIDGKDGPQWVTNHALFRYPTLDAVPAERRRVDSFSRFNTFDLQIAKGDTRKSLDRIKRINRYVRAGGYFNSPARTLWHSLYDCNDRTLSIDFYLGDDPSVPTGEKRSGYLEFTLKR